MFRLAEEGDAELLWRWRREAEREGAEGGWWEGKSPTFQEHTEWLAERLGHILILIWEDNYHGDVGTVRIESNGEIAFHVEHKYRDTEIPHRMLLMAVRRFPEFYGGRLKATVDAGNREAWEALEAAGFQEYPVKFLCFKAAA